MTQPNRSAIPRCPLQRCFRVAALLLMLAVSTALAMGAEKEGLKPSPQTTDEGSGIITQVQRLPQRGQPSREEQQHITVLGAQLMHQIARARRAFDADDRVAADEAVGKARTALKLIRQMLPKSVVSTTVMDPAGTVLYEDVEDVQEPFVTVSRSFTAIDVVRPILESKRASDDAIGEQFEGHATIEADIVVDLDYVDRRLREAQRALATNTEQADDALAHAQSQGTTLIVTATESSPLDEAREALQYAHEAAQRKQYGVAEANLRVAREHLLLYREGAPEGAQNQIDDLNKEINAVAQEIKGTTSATHEETTGRLRRFLDRVESWWRQRGQEKGAEAPPAGRKTF